MSVTYPVDGYFNRHDPTKNFEKHLIRAGLGTQSAEINEIQENLIARAKAVGDVLFKDGDIVRDCQCLVNDVTGLVRLDGGALYLRGAVRGVAPETFIIPVNTVVSIGVRLVETVVTELEDPTLRDPATGTRNFDEPGAARLKVEPSWAWDGDGGEGEFFAVYTVENGILLSKEAPPALDGVSTAIARYDRDSAGGNYIVDGLSVSSSYDRVNEKVVVLVGEGRARVNGFAVDIARGLRLPYDADPDLKAVLAEPETFVPSGGTMRIELDNGPLISIHQVRVTAQKTVSVTHGAFAGASDPLPDNSVLSLVSVNQGGTTYVIDSEVKLTSGEVDWSLGGAEPAPGSTYSVTYQYQSPSAGVVTDVDDTGFTLGGPVVSGSVVTVDYTFALPRIDAIVMDTEGRVSRLKGVASQYAPAMPIVPSSQLRLASLHHNWFGDPKVALDAVVVMPMAQLQGLRTMVFDLFDLVAQERLRTDISLADPSAKRGVFVDPFNNDNLRDAGIVQNLSIIDGELMLPIDGTVLSIGTAITTAQLLPYTLEAVISQPNRTGAMKINPYQAFDPIPATISLSPAVDFWTTTEVVWTSPITRRMTSGLMDGGTITTSTGIEVVGIAEASAEFVRQRVVNFTIKGFGPGEILQSLTFDGVTVTPENP